MSCFLTFFFFNDTATTEIYTLSLHDALPISPRARGPRRRGGWSRGIGSACRDRSPGWTSCTAHPSAWKREKRRCAAGSPWRNGRCGRSRTGRTGERDAGRTLALGHVGGRPRGTRAAHPPRRCVLGRHETARSPGARRRRAAPAPDDRGRKPVRRWYRENAACGLDRELLRGAWPHARHPVARLWRRRAPGSPPTRATGGRGGEPRSGGGRGRRARPGRSGTRPGRRLPAPGCGAGPEHRGRERGERQGIALAITGGAVARGAGCPGPGGSDRRDPEKRVGGRGERPGRGACWGGEGGGGAGGAADLHGAARGPAFRRDAGRDAPGGWGGRRTGRGGGRRGRRPREPRGTTR